MLLFTACCGDLNVAVMRGGEGVNILCVCESEEALANLYASVSHS